MGDPVLLGGMIYVGLAHPGVLLDEASLPGLSARDGVRTPPRLAIPTRASECAR